MPKDLYREAFDQTRAAVGDAIKGIRKTAGMSSDPSVIQYENLSPDVFDLMARDPEIGPEMTMEYIRTMEIRRQKGA